MRTVADFDFGNTTTKAERRAPALGPHPVHGDSHVFRNSFARASIVLFEEATPQSSTATRAAATECSSNSEETKFLTWERGRRATFEKTAVVYMNELVRVATGSCGDREVAEDIVQETYYRAWKYWDTFDPGTNCRAWLYKIMFNVIRARIDRTVPTVSLDNPDFESQHPLTAPTVPNLTDVMAVFSALPDDFRAPLVLVAIEGFSYREVAEILGLPIGTVMSRLHRARAAMRKALEDRPRSGLRAANGGEPL